MAQTSKLDKNPAFGEGAISKHQFKGSEPGYVQAEFWLVNWFVPFPMNFSITNTYPIPEWYSFTPVFCNLSLSDVLLMESQSLCSQLENVMLDTMKDQDHSFMVMPLVFLL